MSIDVPCWITLSFLTNLKYRGFDSMLLLVVKERWRRHPEIER